MFFSRIARRGIGSAIFNQLFGAAWLCGMPVWSFSLTIWRESPGGDGLQFLLIYMDLTISLSNIAPIIIELKNTRLNGLIGFLEYICI